VFKINKETYFHRFIDLDRTSLPGFRGYSIGIEKIELKFFAVLAGRRLVYRSVGTVGPYMLGGWVL